MKKHLKLVLSTLLLVSTILLSSACSQEVLDLTQHETPKTYEETKIYTSNIAIDEISVGVTTPSANPPTTGKLTTRTAINLDTDFIPALEQSNFATHAYLVKIDGTENTSQRKIAYLYIPKWTNVTKQGRGQRVQLFSKLTTGTLKWFNGTPVDIQKGDIWKICGIIGGEINTTDKREDDGTLISPAYGYVDFSPSRAGNLLNPTDPNKKNMLTIPFISEWTTVTVVDKNRIKVSNWSYNPTGVLLKMRVKRNTALVPASEHKYVFKSSALSPNGGFSFYDYKLDDDLVNITVNPNEKTILSNWYWDWNTDKRAIPGDNIRSDFSYKYTYDSEQYAQVRATSTDNTYDEFYVWGMPINQQVRYNGILNKDLWRTTKITPYKGGYMLGLQKTTQQGNTTQIEYADEWLFADGSAPTNEWRKFAFSKNLGKVFTVNLGVTLPKDYTGNYPWRNPLERFAKSNATLDANRAFTNTVKPRTQSERNGSNTRNNVTKGILFNTPQEQYMPPRYHVPQSYEMTGITVAINNRQGDAFGFESKGDFYNIDGKAHEYLQYKKTNNYSDNNAQVEGNALLSSTYKSDKNNGVIYGFRFDFDSLTSSRKTTPGNRYRTAYRWKFYFNEPVRDNKGERVVVTSRWIGNADLTIDDIAQESFWNDANYQNTQVYRVLPQWGYNRWKGYHYIYYWSATKRESQDERTYRFYAFDYEGFKRGYSVDDRYLYPVRPIVNWDVHEDDKDYSPRFQVVTEEGGDAYYY